MPAWLKAQCLVAFSWAGPALRLASQSARMELSPTLPATATRIVFPEDHSGEYSPLPLRHTGCAVRVPRGIFMSSGSAKAPTGGPPKFLGKINFIFNTKLLQNVFHILYHMAPAFICPQFYPFILHKAPRSSVAERYNSFTQAVLV